MAENSGEVTPQPQFEVGRGPTEGQEILAEKAIEQPAHTEVAPAKQTPQFSPPAPVQVPPNIQHQGGVQSSTKPATSDLGALDGDRIEKQWVERAKTIVAQTQDDPYTQKKKMSSVKADYIKKRFDKTIPADDAASL